MSRKNNRPRRYSEQGESEIIVLSDSQTIREGLAATKIGAISKRIVKNRSQVTKQHGKKPKIKYQGGFSMDPEKRKLNLYSDLVLSAHEVATIYSNLLKDQEARMIARHNKVKLPPKPKRSAVKAKIADLDIDNLF